MLLVFRGIPIAKSQFYSSKIFELWKLRLQSPKTICVVFVPAPPPFIKMQYPIDFISCRIQWNLSRKDTP